jgi:hypothetical protein
MLDYAIHTATKTHGPIDIKLMMFENGMSHKTIKS